mgnify:CR=1 FL=1
MRKFDESEIYLITLAMAVAAVTIVITAYLMRTDTCVDEKVENASLILKMSEMNQNAKNLSFGECYDFPESQQRVCRLSKYISDPMAGKIIVIEVPQDGTLSSVEKKK